MYICVSQNLEKLTEIAFWLPKSRLIFEMAKKECRKKLKKKELPNYERAALYYYMIKNAFNKQAFGTFGMSHKSWKISMLADLRLSRKRLDGSILENMDIFKLFDKYAGQAIPLLIFLNSNEEEVDRILGFYPADKYLEIVYLYIKIK